ncbi:MAG: hypothetical protein IPM29_04645 [Planctomycetes bacterium]|nr:hypothetical protein [Planctomycetota bacterium]
MTLDAMLPERLKSWIRFLLDPDGYPDPVDVAAWLVAEREVLDAARRFPAAGGDAFAFAVRVAANDWIWHRLAERLEDWVRTSKPKEQKSKEHRRDLERQLREILRDRVESERVIREIQDTCLSTLVDAMLRKIRGSRSFDLRDKRSLRAWIRIFMFEPRGGRNYFTLLERYLKDLRDPDRGVDGAAAGVIAPVDIVSVMEPLGGLCDALALIDRRAIELGTEGRLAIAFMEANYYLHFRLACAAHLSRPLPASARDAAYAFVSPVGAPRAVRTAVARLDGWRCFFLRAAGTPEARRDIRERLEPDANLGGKNGTFGAWLVRARAAARDLRRPADAKSAKRLYDDAVSNYAPMAREAMDELIAKTADADLRSTLKALKSALAERESTEESDHD